MVLGIGYYAERAAGYFTSSEPNFTKTTLDTLTTTEGLCKSMKIGAVQIKVLQKLDLPRFRSFAKYLINQAKEWKVVASTLEVWDLPKRLLALRRGEQNRGGLLAKIGIWGVAFYRVHGFVRSLGELELFSLSKLEASIGSIPIVGNLLLNHFMLAFATFSFSCEIASLVDRIRTDSPATKARIKVLSCIQRIWFYHHDDARRAFHGLPPNNPAQFVADQLYLQNLSNNHLGIPQIERDAFRSLLNQRRFHLNAAGANTELNVLLAPVVDPRWAAMRVPSHPVREFHLHKWTQLVKIEQAQLQRPWVSLAYAITKCFSIVVVKSIFPVYGIVLSFTQDVLVNLSSALPALYKAWLGRYVISELKSVDVSRRYPIVVTRNVDFSMPDNLIAATDLAF